jgi:hypothetical protein
MSFSEAMRRPFTFASTAAVALCALPCFAEPLVIALNDPKVTIRIPDVESFAMEPHPLMAKNPNARLMGGGKSGVTASLLLPTSGADTPATQCASWVAGGVLQRYAPALSELKIVAAGTNAHVLIFSFKVGDLEQLKAFVVSGTGKGHCVEVHISNLNPTSDERAKWFSGFRGVTVVTQ